MLTSKPLLLVLGVCTTAARAERASLPAADSGIRLDTPDDPRFDCNESEDGAGVSCGGLFGFAPEATAGTAVQSACPPSLADRTPLVSGQISGVKADAAWKLSIGRADGVINVTDTGIRWDREKLRTKIFLHRGELSLPQGAADYDAQDSRVADCNSSGAIDGQALSLLGLLACGLSRRRRSAH